MSELVIPKIADIATLKGISMLLALPLLCVAYTFQTGLEISFDDSIWLRLLPTDSESLRIFKIIFIFTLKSLMVSAIAYSFYLLASGLHFVLDFPFLYVTSVIFIALALLGLFGSEKIPELHKYDDFWFYSFIVWGVFLQTMREDVDRKVEKLFS